MTSATPLISIIIPCFNQAEYLIDCLQSAMEQTIGNWEAIVVDDASTRGDIGTVLSRFGDVRIKSIRHESNRGLGAARNTGFRAAKSPLLLPLDSDDMLAPTFLHELSERLLNNSTLDCAYSDFMVFGDSNEIWRFPLQDPWEILKRQWLPGPGVLMRRQLWEAVGGYWEERRYLGNEDWDFWLSATEQGFCQIHIPKPLYLYRRHKSSMSMKMPYYDYAMRDSIYVRHRDLFNRYHMGSEFRADGYENSAMAFWMQRDRLRAAWLALCGFMLEPSRHHLAKLALRALCPDTLVLRARMIKNVILRQLNVNSHDEQTGI